MYLVSVCDINFRNMFYRSLLYYNMMYIVLRYYVLVPDDRLRGTSEGNQYCTQKSRSPSTTVPDDRGTFGMKYSKSALVVLHCCTSFGVQYCQKMHANIKTHHLSAWHFNGKRHKYDRCLCLFFMHNS
jgi:hypothetical protein